tara:strand:- start:423 stop:647 length:225 start_codon:yes stop_codon:yes gene_type:complete
MSTLDTNGSKDLKFLSHEAKLAIAAAHGLTVDQINKRIEIWSLINDPDISKPDLIEAQKQWIELQKGYWSNRNV